MERGKFDGEIVPCDSINGVDASSFASSSFPPQPDYSSKAVQDALRHLASIALIDLCNEAKVEHCRAVRDLRSCRRPVEYVLNLCGHASLCEECSQRCDMCPVCRVPLPKSGNRLRRRFYCECVEAGLITRTPELRLQGKEDDEVHITADVQRLYSLFDVSVDNNLCCLVCQYVTDVCMNESAVSSDPIIAFLLDEAVVKNWCWRTFKRVTIELCGIYKLETNEMKKLVNLFPKYSTKLSALSNVLEVLALSFKGTYSAKLDDLHHLHEAVLKTKQHMAMMMWCIRHEFLENVRSQHSDLSSWRMLLRERKSAAIQRAWPDFVDNTVDSTGQEDNSTLFIEDALLNLQKERRYEPERKVESVIESLMWDGGSSLLRAKIDGLVGLYPFENLRAAIDVLFLYGSPDMVIAKQAIFLYFLYDRQWTIPDEEWRHVLDDFSATFGVSKHSLLESFTFYLLDDHSEQALGEACRFLPEISGPDSHPKIAKVLLERQASDVALMFLRWCGHDGQSDLISLGEAVTAVRVRVECGLLTEAFMYQRKFCSKLKDNKVKHQPVNFSDNEKSDLKLWNGSMDVLVTELCCLCIRRNLVDRMIELPWNSDEEKYLHRCLLDYAVDNPATSVGSLLVVYFLQRYRYREAYLVHCKVKTMERDFISKNDLSDEILDRMRSTSQWREGLVNNCVALLTEVEQQQLKARKSPEGAFSLNSEIYAANEADIPETQGGAGTIFSVPSSSQASLLQMDHEVSPPGILKQGGSLIGSQFKFGNFTSPLFPSGKQSANIQSSSKSLFGITKNFKFGDDLSSGGHKLHSVDASSAKLNGKTSLRVFPEGIQDAQLDDTLLNVEQNGLYGKLQNISPPYSRRIMSKPVRTPISGHGLLDNSQERYATAFGKRRTSVDAMEISWSHEQRAAADAIDGNLNGGPRWRSDDTSDEDEQQSPDRIRGVDVDSVGSILKGSRRSRLVQKMKKPFPLLPSNLQ